MGAKPERLVAACLMRLDNGDLGYTVQHCSLETHQADSPGSEYHRVLYRVSGQPQAHYVYPVS